VTALASVGYSFDDAGRVIGETLDGKTIANGFVYDSASGGLSQVTYPSGVGTAGNGSSMSVTRDSENRTVGVQWFQSGGVNLYNNTVTRSQTGRVLSSTVNGALEWSYGYDAAGRLISATGSGHSFGYDYASSGGCGVSTAAGKNSDRSGWRDGAVTIASYCYDSADRLTSTTQAGYTTAPVYDAHGAVTSQGGDSFFYDQAGRHLATGQGSTRVEYVRDLTDRVVDRKTFDTTGGGSTLVSEQRYVSTGAGDTPDLVLDGTGTVIERTITLPGGAILTDRPTGTSVWSYPNIHGDITATWTTGTVTTTIYDPYGNPITAIPDNAAGNYDWAWLGSLQRGTEHQAGINPGIELGARLYNPALGRFNTTDPITGGNNNPYTYPNDPINTSDPNGNCAKHHGIWGWTRDHTCNIGDAGRRAGSVLAGSLLSNLHLVERSLDVLNRTVICPASRGSSLFDLKGRAVAAGGWLPGYWLAKITRDQAGASSALASFSFQVLALSTVGDIACSMSGY